MHEFQKGHAQRMGFSGGILEFLGGNKAGVNKLLSNYKHAEQHTRGNVLAALISSPHSPGLYFSGGEKVLIFKTQKGLREIMKGYLV